MHNAIKTLAVLILFIILVLSFLRNDICLELIDQACARTTGLEISIGSLNLDPLRSKLSMQDITLYNPPGFESDILAHANMISLRYSPFRLASGRFYFREARADIEEINIIRAENGASNVTNFKKMRAAHKNKKKRQTLPSAQKEDKKTAKKDVQPKFFIEKLEISLGKATFWDYRADAENPNKIVFALQGPSTFTNVSDLNYVVDSVSAKGGFKNAFGLLGIAPQGLLKSAGEAISEKIIKVFPKAEKDDGTP
ncbi:MAG: hypothetical protein JW869_01180 [Candidatus Omnitrophica bacterium]|nr:hypothetical protein [Candidatus Omnitrophota bacterium]